MSIFVFRGNRQKWNIIFGIQLMEKHVLAFYEDNKERDIPLLTDLENKWYSAKKSTNAVLQLTYSN